MWGAHAYNLGLLWPRFGRRLSRLQAQCFVMTEVSSHLGVDADPVWSVVLARLSMQPWIILNWSPSKHSPVVKAADSPYRSIWPKQKMKLFSLFAARKFTQYAMSLWDTKIKKKVHVHLGVGHHSLHVIQLLSRFPVHVWNHTDLNKLRISNVGFT